MPRIFLNTSRPFFAGFSCLLKLIFTMDFERPRGDCRDPVEVWLDLQLKKKKTRKLVGETIIAPLDEVSSLVLVVLVVSETTPSIKD